VLAGQAGVLGRLRARRLQHHLGLVQQGAFVQQATQAESELGALGRQRVRPARVRDGLVRPSELGEDDRGGVVRAGVIRPLREQRLGRGQSALELGGIGRARAYTAAKVWSDSGTFGASVSRRAAALRASWNWRARIVGHGEVC
jgi:hypothetical protein